MPTLLPSQQRLVVACITFLLLLAHIARLHFDNQPLNIKLLFPSLLFGSTLASLPAMVDGQNWARRTLLLVTFAWLIADGASLWMRWSTATMACVAGDLAIFIWLLHPSGRSQFTLVSRNWGFAQIVMGSLILLGKVNAFIAPNTGPIRLLKANNADEAFGMTVANFATIIFCVWLIWKGIQKERRDSPHYSTQPAHDSHDRTA